MTFLKRDREMKLKQRALDKAARRAQRKDNPNAGKGPPIDFESQNFGNSFTSGDVPGAPPPEHGESPPIDASPGPETK